MGTQEIKIKIVSTPSELQQAFFVRGVVFIEGQNCPYRLEHDEHDYSSKHFLVMSGDEPVGTARIRFIKGGVKFERFAVRKEYRESGIGKALLQFVLDHIRELGFSKVMMNAQAYLTGYYEKFGFVRSGDLFLEAGIEHYYMERHL